MNSMTAFSRTAAQLGQFEWVWEMKSVNHRFLDQFYRLPETFRSLEPKLRQIAVLHLQRGRFEVFLQIKQITETMPELNLNLMKNYQEVAKTVEQALGIENNLKLSDYLTLPQIWSQQGLELLPELQTAMLKSFEQVISQLSLVRRQEGESICKILQAKLTKLSEILSQVKQLAGLSSTQMKTNFQEKMANWYSGQYDEQRFEQELVYQLLKVDITEEIDRLDTHLQEFKRVIHKEEHCGRRLDFLVQECHRETNTIGSKTDSSQISQMVIDMKVIIEQLREQIQNVE